MTKKRNNQWSKMTKAERSAEMKRRRQVAEARKNLYVPPKNPNQLQQAGTQAMEYSYHQKHLADVQEQLRTTRQTAVEMIANVAEIALRAIR